MASTDQNETLIERTLSNLAGAWREIARSAARSVGRNGRAVAGSQIKTNPSVYAAADYWHGKRHFGHRG